MDLRHLRAFACSYSPTDGGIANGAATSLGGSGSGSGQQHAMFGFELLGKEKTFVALASSEVERDEWLRDITSWSAAAASASFTASTSTSTSKAPSSTSKSKRLTMLGGSVMGGGGGGGGAAAGGGGGGGGGGGKAQQPFRSANDTTERPLDEIKAVAVVGSEERSEVNAKGKTTKTWSVYQLKVAQYGGNSWIVNKRYSSLLEFHKQTKKATGSEAIENFPFPEKTIFKTVMV